MHDCKEHDHIEATADRVSRRPLAIAFAITLAFLIVEVIGGLLTNSLALLANAGHMATDAAALGIALWAVWLARRPATAAHSYGCLRADVLAALLNAAALIVMSLYIFWEAYQRLGAPPEVHSGLMLIVAIAGLGANAASAWVLMRGGDHEQNLNTRGAFLHVIGDMLGSVGAIAAALIMLATGWYQVDPLLSAGVGLLILWSAWRLVRESIAVLLEATPPGVDHAVVRAAIGTVAGVEGVHDLHVWTVTSGVVALSSHVEVAEQHQWPSVLTQLTALLRTRFDIGHVTLQPEPLATHSDSFRGYSLSSSAGRVACGFAGPCMRPAYVHHHGHRH